MENQLPERVIFFDGKDIAVVGNLFPDSERLVISFSSRINSGKPILAPVEELLQRETDTVFEGESFFSKRGIPAIFFLARRNDWWQSSEIWDAIKTLENFNLWNKYEHITTYGLSMGGYGALIFSKAVRANRVIAIAPQFSINTEVVPFETRWAEDRERIQFTYDDMADGLIQDGEVIVFYDRFFDFDKRHVDMIADIRPVDKFLVNFSTHTVARALNDMGIFSQIMERLFNRQLNKKEFRDLVRSYRNRSPLLLHNMAHTVKRQGRAEIASTLYMRALDVMEERVKIKPDAYHKFYNALSSIRVVENYIKELIALKKLTTEDLMRAERLVQFYILPSSYSGWQLMKAQASMELKQLDDVKQSLDLIESSILSGELNKYLSVYAKFSVFRPDPQKVVEIQQRFDSQIIKNDTACLNMGNMLIAVDLKAEALPYFERVLGEQLRADVTVNHRQALVGIAKCSGLEHALSRYDQVLGHNSTGPNYQKVKNVIMRLAR